MPADRGDAACTVAGVRKPSRKPRWGGGAAGFDLSGLDACCCRHLPAQLLRYGTNVANGGKQLLHHVQFQRVTCGKNSPYFNFCVMWLIASSVPHRAKRYFQVIDAIRRKLFSLSSLYITGGHRCISDRTGSVL